MYIFLYCKRNDISKYGLWQAKKDTVDKVCEIVKKQLALPDHTEVCGESKFSELGADSLDTVNHNISCWCHLYSHFLNDFVMEMYGC